MAHRVISTHILTKRMTLKDLSIRCSMKISTHILTKRMTHFLQNSRWRNCISTHILTKRMTTLTLQAQRLTKHFNSHPHEEDDGELIDFSTITDISTHILTKRMTIIRQIISWILNISTHILTKRMTTKETTLKTTNLFQLTSSRRG